MIGRLGGQRLFVTLLFHPVEACQLLFDFSKLETAKAILQEKGLFSPYSSFRVSTRVDNRIQSGL